MWEYRPLSFARSVIGYRSCVFEQGPYSAVSVLKTGAWHSVYARLQVQPFTGGGSGLRIRLCF